MSGKKQHHIPQSVQRGFLFDVKAEKTYVHRRDGKHYPASISDVLAQRFFYSRLSSDGSKTLDDTITEYESRLGGLLTQLRAIPLGGSVEAALAAEVIAHLTPRSANLRRMFGSSMEQIMVVTAQAFADEDTVMTMLGLAEPEPNPVWNGHFTRIFEKEPQLKALLELVPIDRSLLDRMLFMATKEQFAGNFDAAASSIAQLLSLVLNGLDDLVREGHNKALGKSLIAEARVKSLEALQWHILAGPPEGAILPDCVAIGMGDEQTGFLPYIMTNTASVSVAVMPLNSEKLLVGTRTGEAASRLKDFNWEAAACSDELFITASQAPIFDELRKAMGTRWVGEIEALIQGVRKGLLPSKNQTIGSGKGSPPLSRLTYQLTFNGMGTEGQIAPYRERTQRVVSALRAGFNLDRLDGITFAADLKTALEELDRGFDVNNTPEVEPDHMAQGAATALILRGGVPKIRIILNASYAAALVGEETQATEAVIHLIAAGVVQSDTLARVEKTLPGFLLEPVMTSDHDGVLHCAVRKALRAYRYARDSAEIGASDLFEAEFSKYLTETFEAAYASIARAKEEHGATPNFPRLFAAAHEAAKGILTSTARLIGHRHGMGKYEISAADASVGATLVARQLTSWAGMFSNDLQRFWQKETWTRADFHGLNIHAERVLWAGGVLLWREPTGNGTMIMPTNLANSFFSAKSA